MSWACDPASTAPILQSFQLGGPVFVNALQSFFAAQCALVGDHLWPNDVTDSVLRDPNYDFIVVGAGSAGAVVANRLTEIPHWKVLLIEAGGNPTLATEIPQLFYNNLNSPEDWKYKTQSQDGACRGYKTKGCAWPRGKVLGGCSSINAMFYVRANKVDYDEWAAAGNKGWSYKEILPYFKKSENLSHPLTFETAKYHATGGYLNVEFGEHIEDIEEVILKANEELGTKIIDDINGNDQMGATKSPTTTKNGIRYSTARAFLSPVKNRPNLHVMKNAYVTKILLDDVSNEAKGVIVNKDGKDFFVYGNKEVILSAGSINTPQLLMLSGIGPKKHLEANKIEVKSDLPVGENLQDHAFVPITFTLKSELDFTTPANVLEAIAEQLFNSRGILSGTFPHRITGFINTTDPKASSPNVQQHYLVFPPNETKVVDFFELHGFSEEYNRKFKEMNKDNLVIIAYSVLLKPKSKGRVLLKSNNPYDYPLIFANYFDDPEDIKIMINGMKYILKLADTQVFKNVGLQLQWLDIEACQKFADKTSDDFLECIAREMTMSLYHPTSTARMGPEGDRSAVVDTNLKVKGIKRLRVIDASVMPSVTRGNTNAPTIMIGEKGADLIKSEWLNEHTEL